MDFIDSPVLVEKNSMSIQRNAKLKKPVVSFVTTNYFDAQPLESISKTAIRGKHLAIFNTSFELCKSNPKSLFPVGHPFTQKEKAGKTRCSLDTGIPGGGESALSQSFMDTKQHANIPVAQSELTTRFVDTITLQSH
jgi:hypothetical protein